MCQLIQTQACNDSNYIWEFQFEQSVKLETLKGSLYTFSSNQREQFEEIILFVQPSSTHHVQPDNVAYNKRKHKGVNQPKCVSSCLCTR